MATVTITSFGLEAGTDRKLYVNWSWNKEHTKNFSVHWMYGTSGNFNNGEYEWFVGLYEDTTKYQHTYTAPSNAVVVRVTVKPISETYTVKTQNGSYETNYWTAEWSTYYKYYFTEVPETPSSPRVTLKDYLLTASLDGLSSDVTSVQFEVVKDDSTLFNTAQADVTTGHVEYSCYVDAGSKYKVRCRTCQYGSNALGEYDLLYSEWSEYSDNVSTIPSGPSGFTECRAKTATSVYLEWEAVNTATSYDIEYATQLDYFDGSDKTQLITGIETTRYEKTGLEEGGIYFFRFRAVNSEGKSPWSKISSATVGKSPAAPTTWSSTTTVITGEPLIFYWVHNSEDGSSQTKAELEVSVNGTVHTYTIQNSTAEDEKDKTSSYTLSTSGYLEGGKILWRVRTAGVTGVYGDWSVQRTVDIYAPPALELDVTNSTGASIATLTSFPFYISGTAGPNTQTPIGYHISITSNETYETVDNIGNAKIVNSGEEVYSKYFNTSEDLLLKLSASDLNIENGITYTVTCTVSMNSGLTGEASSELTVLWEDDTFWPDAEIGYDANTYSASIGPFCTNETGNLVSGVTLSVYRREFDGSFTELATGIDNTKRTFVTDPHPALDFARYRIVATDTSTGKISYYDPPGYPVGEKAVIIQWNEAWNSFESDSSDALEQPEWSGSLLRLPYNIDVSDSNDIDVELVEYIGRQHPVSYYGTQLGQTSSWSVEIVKSDKETLYALRRLAVWMGDVYVREPSGSGYWANVSVSFSQKHAELTIPVTIDISRVAGGI